MTEYKKRERPSWDDYFIDLVLDTAERSSCLKRHVGALTVKDRRLLTTGYNGAPRDNIPCYDSGKCWRREQNIAHGTNKDLCMAAHAEANAIAQAANQGISLKGATLYVTTFPCTTCSHLLIPAGIVEVKYIMDYYGRHKKFAGTILKNAGIITRKIEIDSEKLARKHPTLKLVTDTE